MRRNVKHGESRENREALHTHTQNRTQDIVVNVLGLALGRRSRILDRFCGGCGSPIWTQDAFFLTRQMSDNQIRGRSEDLVLRLPFLKTISDMLVKIH